MKCCSATGNTFGKCALQPTGSAALIQPLLYSIGEKVESTGVRVCEVVREHGQDLVNNISRDIRIASKLIVAEMKSMNGELKTTGKSMVGELRKVTKEIGKCHTGK